MEAFRGSQNVTTKKHMDNAKNGHTTNWQWGNPISWKPSVIFRVYWLKTVKRGALILWKASDMLYGIEVLKNP